MTERATTPAAELSPAECDAYLRELNPSRRHTRIYTFLCKALARGGLNLYGTLPRRVLHRVARRVPLPRDLLFVATSGGGVPFLADARDLDSYQWIANRGHNAPLVRAIVEGYKHSPGAVLDVGANVGLLSLMADRALGGAADVFAFEPVPPVWRRAAVTLALNRPSRVRLLPVAVGSREGETDLFYLPSQSGLSGGHAEGADRVAVRVPLTTLDALRAQGVFGKVGVLKVDVEGFESDVLKGAAWIIANDRPTIIYEFNPGILRREASPTDVAEEIGRLAPYRFAIQDPSGNSIAYPPPPGFSTFSDVICTPV